MRRHGRARRKTFPQCRHRGFGEHCHRCAQADVLLIASNGHGPGPLGARADWTPQDMADESERLRKSPPQRTGNWQPGKDEAAP